MWILRFNRVKIIAQPYFLEITIYFFQKNHNLWAALSFIMISCVMLKGIFIWAKIDHTDMVIWVLIANVQILVYSFNFFLAY